MYTALERLTEAEQKPPMGVVYEWIGLSEQVKAQNELMNQEAARLTSVFEKAGHRTAILKGQANARLYPQPWSRQPGDIDIWVDGGREKVIETTKRLGLLKGEIVRYQSDGKTTQSYHHIHLPKNENGVDVEVHYRPSSGNYNPFTNRRLQEFLNAEIDQHQELTDEGFRVPGLRFALVMQLAHIQRHLISEGVGMRQVMDYYYLLRSDVDRQRDEVIGLLRAFGLNHTAGALMWLLHEKLGLEEQYLIAPMDEKRGRMLTKAIVEGGNFGHYHPRNTRMSLWARIRSKHQHRLTMLRFDAREAFWTEMNFVKFFISTIPARIKRRKWSLGGLDSITCR